MGIKRARAVIREEFQPSGNKSGGMRKTREKMAVNPHRTHSLTLAPNLFCL
ncbi:hypothetical protein JOQ06_026965, partial [Pogonophryne albipinna]